MKNKMIDLIKFLIFMISTVTGEITIFEAKSILGHAKKRVAVFCGSASGNDEHIRNARRFGELLSENDCALVYGGGEWGLMGEVARNCPNNIGVPPDFMLPISGRIIVVKSMAERKTVMDELADCFVVLPGGFGTLDEVSEMLTWNQLGINNKLIVFINSDHYYDHLFNWIEHGKANGFINPIHTANLVLVDSPEQAIHEVLHRPLLPVSGKFRTRI